MIKYLKSFVFNVIGAMVKEIFSRIIEAIEEKVLDNEIKIDKNRFVEIKKKENENKIVFIDGGQAELLKAVNFSLQMIRIGAVVFKNNKKVDSVLDEFFVLVYAEGDDYKTEIFPLKGGAVDEIKINSLDASIREGNERASVSKIGGIVRRFAELEMAGRMIEKLEKWDFVVLDGSLKAMVSGEETHVNKLFEKAEKNGIIVSGLAKTSKIMQEGVCVASQLNRAAGMKEEWYYELEEGICMTRLNKSSAHVFEFNINIKQKKFTEDVLSSLAANSKDAVFPGYPYGLILVDKFARISNQEKEYWITRFKASAGEKWGKLKENVNVLNAHDILDNI